MECTSFSGYLSRNGPVGLIARARLVLRTVVVMDRSETFDSICRRPQKMAIDESPMNNRGYAPTRDSRCPAIGREYFLLLLPP